MMKNMIVPVIPKLISLWIFFPLEYFMARMFRIIENGIEM